MLTLKAGGVQEPKKVKNHWCCVARLLISKFTNEILVQFKNHWSKYCVARPLISNCTNEILDQLKEVYLLLGTHKTIQHDQGNEFSSYVIVHHNYNSPPLLNL